MIKGLYETRLTPKQKAQEIIGDKIQQPAYWTEWDDSLHLMTQRELDEVERHLRLQVARLINVGFDIK